MRLKTRGTPGHASMLNTDNAVAKLAAGVTRLSAHQFPQIITPALADFLAGVTDLTGMEFPADDLDSAVAKLGNLSRIVGATLRDTATVTTFQAGYKGNVVPSSAEATVDCRILPGRETAFYEELADILGPDIEREWDDLPPVQTTFDGALVDAMTNALVAEDPTARGCCPTCFRPAPTPSPSPSWASDVSALPRFNCRRISTSRRCSTASTSGCRWPHWSSAPGCSTVSCVPADVGRRQPGNTMITVRP